MRIGEHESHPFADTFPLMRPEALKSLAASIKAEGQKRPIDIINGQILDGRNRYLACLLAKVAPVFVEVSGDDDWALQHVIACNLDRRDLEEGQRALAVRRLEACWTKLCKAAKRSANQAALPHVAEVTAEQAERLDEDGTPELVAAVDRGDIPLSVAADIARHEPEVQRAAVERIEQGVKAQNEPVRAKRDDVRMASVVVELSPMEMMQLKALMHLGAKSVHAEAREGSKVLRRVVPGVGR